MQFKQIAYKTFQTVVPLSYLIASSLITCERLLADTVSNDCGDSSITYCFEDCVLTRIVSSSSYICVDVPGIQSEVCRKIHRSSQGGVQSVSMDFSSATITPCVSEGSFACGASSDDCDVTAMFLDECKDSVGRNSWIVNSYSDSMAESKSVSYDSMWDGKNVLFTVTNSLDSPYVVSWAGTPFNGVTVMPGEQVTRATPQRTAPTVSQGTIELLDSSTGLAVRLDATNLATEACGPAIRPECFLVVGTRLVDLSFSSGARLVVDPISIVPVSAGAMPSFVLPSRPSWSGVHIYFQAILKNPSASPGERVRSSNGLGLEIGSGVTEIGTASNVRLDLIGSPMSGEEVTFEVTTFATWES